MHELVIGTKAELDQHAALQEKFPDVEHDETYMVHVGPGQRGEIVWLFNRAGEFDFVCLPGMPIGSPGWDGPVYGGRRDPNDVLPLAHDGTASVFRRHA